MKPPRPISVTDRYRLKELTLQQVGTVPPGRVMWCRDRKVLGFADVANLANAFSIPKDANTICVSPADFAELKEWARMTDEVMHSIGEVSAELGLPLHTLHFWERRFTQLEPVRRPGCRRFYRAEDIELLRGIRHLLYVRGYTIRGVQLILKEEGVKAVRKAFP